VAAIARDRRCVGTRMHLFLQPLQRFRHQGRDRLARLLGERHQQTFLFQCQLKWVCVHTLAISRAWHIFKKSLNNLALLPRTTDNDT